MDGGLLPSFRVYSAKIRESCLVSRVLINQTPLYTWRMYEYQSRDVTHVQIN